MFMIAHNGYILCILLCLDMSFKVVDVIIFVYYDNKNMIFFLIRVSIFVEDV